MNRQYRESGAALIMLMGMTASLTILTASLVMLLANQQHATAAHASEDVPDYAEAALDSGVNSIKSRPSGVELPDIVSRHRYGPREHAAQMNVQYAGRMSLARAHAALRRLRQHATPVDTSTHWDANLDHKLWVEATVTFLGRKSRLRQMLDSSTELVVLPLAAMYADTSIVAKDTSDVYAVKPDGSFITRASGLQLQDYVTLHHGGDDLISGTRARTSAARRAPRSRSASTSTARSPLPGLTTRLKVGEVGLLSDYFDRARQYDLTVRRSPAWTWRSMHTVHSAPSSLQAPGTTVASTQFTPANLTTAYLTSIGASFNSGTKTYTFSSPIAVTGNLALNSAARQVPDGDHLQLQHAVRDQRDLHRVR